TGCQDRCRASSAALPAGSTATFSWGILRPQPPDGISRRRSAATRRTSAAAAPLPIATKVCIVHEGLPIADEARQCMRSCCGAEVHLPQLDLAYIGFRLAALQTLCQLQLNRGAGD